MSYTERRIYNSALHYLQRYASTAAQLRRVMQRKMTRATLRGEEVPPEASQWIEKTVEKCVALGYVNDRIYAESKVTSMRRQGRSKMVIAQTLQLKGVARELIAELLQEGDDTDTEFDAAQRMVKRKRLGRDTTPEGRQKDLGKLLRAGFSMNVARKALAQAQHEADN